MARIIKHPDYFCVQFDKNEYYAGLIQDFKSISSKLRSFMPFQNAWYFENTLFDAVLRYMSNNFCFYETEINSQKNTEYKDTLYVLYLSTPEKINTGNIASLYAVKHISQIESALTFPQFINWNFLAYQSVLESFFGVQNTQNETDCYKILGVNENDSQEHIKKMWKRLILQWHPDHCKEANARDVFDKIQNAYETLKNPEKKERYNKLNKMADIFMSAKKGKEFGGFYPKFRSGIASVQCISHLGNKTKITKILNWEDIVEDNKTLVVSFKESKFHYVWK